jgi:hypothetical protein
MRPASGRGMASASDDERTRRGGRPRLPPIRLLPPTLVPMTVRQQEIAIQTLAVLLDSWLKGEQYRPDRREVARQPKKRLKTLSRRPDGARHV